MNRNTFFPFELLCFLFIAGTNVYRKQLKRGEEVSQMWSVVKENVHLVHLKEVTDLGTNYK